MINKTIAIHQPNYIPWLGYFYKIWQSDIFVFLDDVQFTNEGMQNYHYIKTPQGPFRLKIPVQHNFGDTIAKVTIRYELDWVKKHLKTIEMNYKKSAFFEEVYNDFKSVLSGGHQTLSELDISLIKYFSNKLNIDTSFINSSELDIQTVREEKILDICNALKGTTYYSGTGAKTYQIEEDFLDRGIELKYSSFKPFGYPQLWGQFQSNVSILDYLMNCGYDWERVLKMQNNE